MFIRIEYNRERDREFIIDSDFESMIDDVITASRMMVKQDGIVIIHEYEKRNLNVAVNLFRLAQWLHEKFKYDFHYTFNIWKEHIPEYKKYEDKMLKYLLLVE